MSTKSEEIFRYNTLQILCYKYFRAGTSSTKLVNEEKLQYVY